MQTQHAAAVLAALLVASTSALDAAYAPAKLQWQAKTRDTTVLLLTETEGAKQTAQAMWPVGAAIEALLNDFEDAQNVICCLPFATGKDCATFGLRRYEKGAAWALGSAANVGSAGRRPRRSMGIETAAPSRCAAPSSPSTRRSRMEC